MPVILETNSWILKYVNVGVDELNVRYGMRFAYSVYFLEIKARTVLILHCTARTLHRGMNLDFIKILFPYVLTWGFINQDVLVLTTIR